MKKTRFRFRKVTLTIAAALLSACATPQQPAVDDRGAAARPQVEISTEARGCSVIVYRTATAFHSANPERPFVYVGEQRIGTLRTGAFYCLRMAEGKYTVSIKEPILFMPSYTSGTLDIQVSASSPVYIRYSKEFAGVAQAGANTVPTSESRLGLATEEQWRKRM